MCLPDPVPTRDKVEVAPGEGEQHLGNRLNSLIFLYVKKYGLPEFRASGVSSVSCSDFAWFSLGSTER